MTRDLGETLTSAEALARQAVALDGADAEARTCLGRLLLHRGNYEGSRAEVERALAISPNLASAHGILGGTLIFSSRPKEGLVALERGIRLDPRDPRSGISVNQVVLAHYFGREYEAAVEAAKRVISSFPDHPLVYRWLAAALGQLRAHPGSERGAGQGHRPRPGFIQHLRPRARALARAGGSRTHGRGAAQGRLGGVKGRLLFAAAAERAASERPQRGRRRPTTCRLGMAERGGEPTIIDCASSDAFAPYSGQRQIIWPTVCERMHAWQKRSRSALISTVRTR